MFLCLQLHTYQCAQILITLSTASIAFLLFPFRIIKHVNMWCTPRVLNCYLTKCSKQIKLCQKELKILQKCYNAKWHNFIHSNCQPLSLEQQNVQNSRPAHQVCRSRLCMDCWFESASHFQLQWNKIISFFEFKIYSMEHYHIDNIPYYAYTTSSQQQNLKMLQCIL